MNRSTFVTFLLLAFSIQLSAQDMSLFKPGYFANGKDTIHYRIMYPENYDAAKKYPFLLFLHGAGERGNDNKRQLSKGASLFSSKATRQQYPAIVVFPQCSFASFWSMINIRFDTTTRRPSLAFPENGEPTMAMRLLLGMTDSLLTSLPVKKDQVYVGGLSMGGMGTFEIVKRMPGVFAAAFPICGGANPANADDLTKTAWWVFHGEQDPVVAFQFSEDMVAALKKDGALVKFTAYPEAKHNSWDNAFAEPALLPWVFSQRLHK